jgi:hypothetical protein
VITIALPPPGLLLAAPQLATLTILHAALLTAEDMLIAHYPDVDYNGYRDDAPAAAETFLVPIIVARLDELRHLLDRYYAAVKDSFLAPVDDFPF